MANLAAKYLQKTKTDPVGVVGFDLAGQYQKKSLFSTLWTILNKVKSISGDEGSFPLNSWDSDFIEGLKKAKSENVPITVHAGEWPERFKTLENVKFAIDELKVQRIGHGIALRSDHSYLKGLSEKNVTIEVSDFENLLYTHLWRSRTTVL